MFRLLSKPVLCLPCSEEFSPTTLPTAQVQLFSWYLKTEPLNSSFSLPSRVFWLHFRCPAPSPARPSAPLRGNPSSLLAKAPHLLSDPEHLSRPSSRSALHAALPGFYPALIVSVVTRPWENHILVSKYTCLVEDLSSTSCYCMRIAE